MEKYFTKRELKEKLGMKDDDIKIVMKFQKKLQILTDDGEGFCVSAKILHEQLGVGRDFSTWIKGRINKFNFEENTDYILENLIHQNGGINNHGGDRKSKDYILTMGMAKELSMVENNENGRIARKYFIVMEKALRDNILWGKVREPEKTMYKAMCNELDLYMQRNLNKKAEQHHYINEANALNLICLGARAKDIREYIGAQDKNTREHILAEYNLYLWKMEELNTMFLRMNMDRDVRYNMIQQGFKATYPHASFVMADRQLEENYKKDYLSSVI